MHFLCRELGEIRLQIAITLLLVIEGLFGAQDALGDPR